MRVVLRIRTGPEKRVRLDRPANRALASRGASLALPTALVSFLMCAWRWAYELSWTGSFPIPSGLFSHWQAWFVLGAIGQAVTVKLWRYSATESKPGDFRRRMYTAQTR